MSWQTMKEAYAVRRTVPPSAEIQASIDKLLSKGMVEDPQKMLSELGRLGARLIGGFVRGLSMRDIESLCEEAGLARISKSSVSRLCAELHERFEAFKRRSLYDINLVVLFLDAIYLPVRPSGPKEGVICAWGITENGSRELVSVRLGMRETKQDWLELGRDLIARGLPAPRLVVADGAAGLPSAIEEIWPRADRQRCAVHRLRNLLAKLPKSEHDRIRFNYWAALTDATSVKDGKLRLQILISELEHRGYESAARCLADDLDALVVHLRYPLRHRERWRSTNLLERSLGEVRRRTKVMGRFPGETSCLSLVWAVLDLFFTHASNGATFADVDRQHLYRIKYHQADPDTLDEE
jgi:putative transposase